MDLSDVGFVKRITVGSKTPEAQGSESENEAAMDLVNRCLSDAPKGRLLGLEKSFTLVDIGDQQVVVQFLTYHIGFTRKPVWMQG